MNMHLTYSGEDFSKVLDRLSQADVHAFYDAAGQSLTDDVRERFQTGEAPDGSHWTPSVRALRDGGKTLIDTSVLVSSFTHYVTSDGFVVGTPEKYAAAHQFGVDRRVTVTVPEHTRTISQAFGKPISSKQVRVKTHTKTVHMRLPARPILGIADQQMQRIDGVWTDWMESLIDGD